MTIPPAAADMKRGALGPSPARRNLLWESTRARQQAQIAPVEVAAREGKGGAFIRVTGSHSTEEGMGRALGAYNTATNRAACRAGHVLVGKYRAARAAEQSVPAPVAVGGERWAVREDRPAPEELPKGGASHSGADAIAAILAVHARCVEARG